MANPNSMKAKTKTDTTGWLTELQLQDMLNVSHVTIKRWRDHGRLHPVRSERSDGKPGRTEIWFYDPAEVAKIPRRAESARPVVTNEGELCARVFELLDEGRPMREIVIRTRESATKIAELREQWLDLGGSELVVNDNARTELIRLVGEFSSVAELVAGVAKLAQIEIVATVPDGASDAQIEGAIVAALDAADASRT